MFPAPLRLWSFVLSTVAALCALPSVASALEFAPTIDAARAVEAAATPEARKPVVVMFSSASCVWCRKMEIDTFPDDRVAELADRFLWVKVDVDEHEELAARYGVRGLPHTFVLNGEDRPIASQPGYVPPEPFVAFLKQALENPQPIDDVLPDLLGRLAAAAEPDERDETLTKIVERLAAAEREGRPAALAAVSQAGPAVWPHLLALMSDERLAVRAAAAGTLAHVTKAGLPFDPFAPDEQRLKQAAEWEEWVRSNGERPGNAAVP
jgi:thioredoxin-related protein